MSKNHERKPLLLNPVGANEWDVQCDGIDYHLSIDKNGNWVVDEFDSSIKDPDKAHVSSLSFDNGIQDVIDHISRR